MTAESPRLTVLVADDDPEIRALLARWLADGPFDLRMADSATAALDLCRTERVDVAICDVMMPGHDGLWLADQLRRHAPATQVIFGTALDDLPGMRTLAPGVAGYLVKPFQRAHVRAAVEAALQTQQTAV